MADRSPNPTEQEMIARGTTVFEQCYNGVVPLPAKVAPGTYAGTSMKMFDDVWGNVALPMRDKRLIVMGILAGLGADPGLFAIHARSALRNHEIDADELRAFVLMALPYVGYPRASPLYLQSETLIAEESGA